MHNEIRSPQQTFVSDMARQYRLANSPSDRDRVDAFVSLALRTGKIIQGDADLYETEKRRQNKISKKVGE